MTESFPRPTKTYRPSSYDTISPNRPELSLAGQTILITGGATGVGLETTKAFAQAGAARIILLARSEGPMTEAKKTVELAFPQTKVETRAVSITDLEQVNTIVSNLGSIDVLVLNAGITHRPVPILKLDASEIENVFQTNVFGTLNIIKAFIKQAENNSHSRKTIIYTSAYGINFVMGNVGAYSASKAAMTYIMRCIAEENPESNIRTFTFHPCVAYTSMAKDALGLDEEAMKFDTVDLPAHYAVWLCSPKADFLKGRFLSANWDVEELRAKADLIKKDPSLLKNMVHLGALQE